jgi:hypothetical protein
MEPKGSSLGLQNPGYLNLFRGSSKFIFSQPIYIIYIILPTIYRCIYFINGLFNDAAVNSDYTVLNGRTIMTNEIEIMWKEAVMA